MNRPLSELFVTLTDWVISTGAEHLDRLPGLWHGETDEWTVRVNGHMHEVEGVAPVTFELTHKIYFTGLAIVSPYDGALIGISEDGLIAHFKAAAQVPA